MKTIEQHRQENEPDIVRLAEAIVPLCWQHEGGSNLRESSLRMAVRVREHFKIERSEAEHMAWELGAAYTRQQAEAERAAREASPAYHWRGLWRAVFRRSKAEPAVCPHQVGWDDCPECSH